MSAVQPHPRDWGGPLRLAIGLLSAFLLTSMGGAQFIAAPAIGIGIAVAVVATIVVFGQTAWTKRPSSTA